jgi:hypothetical protein
MNGYSFGQHLNAASACKNSRETYLWWWVTRYHLEVTMRKLLAAATALGLFTASLPATAADTTAKTPAPASAAAAKPKTVKIDKVKHHAGRLHRKHFVRHHRHHPRMAVHKAHRKHLAIHKKHQPKHHQVRKTAKSAARTNG